MKTRFSVSVFVVAASLAGCASGGRVSDLEARVNRIEGRVVAAESAISTSRKVTDRIRIEDSENGAFVYVRPR